MNKSSKNLWSESLILGLMVGTTALYQMPTSFAANAPSTTISNNTLPTGEHDTIGIGKIERNGDTMNITQNNTNGVIKWGDFSIGANATVNFNKNDGNTFHTLNYVTGKNTSLIYGRMNAANNGHVYLVNPNGVQIGNSAQINVGSLYVSNKKLDETKFNQFNGNNLNNLGVAASPTNAEIMNLGNINANNVTFDGDRVVLDVDRITKNINMEPSDSITINSASGDVVLASNNGTVNSNVLVNGKQVNNAENKYNYTWIKDILGLQNINKNLHKNYAVKNSIDAIVTKDWKDNNGDAYNKGFKPIGADDAKGFTGKFDGLNYSIFGLNINRNEKTDSDVGLFGKTNGASINNLKLIGGNVNGYKNTGALVGNAQNTTISNITNSIDVSGMTNTGGVVGQAVDTNLDTVFNNATIHGNIATGGLVGLMEKGSLTGESYNFGDVHGAYYKYINPGSTNKLLDGNIDQTDMFVSDTSKYIGGLVGDGKDVSIGNKNGFQMYNITDIVGGSNVGGIAGRIQGNSTIQNARNEGSITATYKDGIFDEINYGKADINKGTYDSSSIYANAANVGGIVGKSGNYGDDIHLTNVTNRGNIQSSKADLSYNTDQKYNGYYAGNVGGIVGYANHTKIYGATNQQANISGSHNVGGIAGHLNLFSTVTQSRNEGGTIHATGVVSGNTIAKMDKAPDQPKDGDVTDSGVGDSVMANVGGIAGYISRNSKIASTANSGDVSSDKIGNLMVFGTGGIVGRIDQLDTEVPTEQVVWDNLKKDASTAVVYDSYNTGKISGDRGVGGIAGAIYNGSVANSYNSGNILTTGSGSIGGIVGDARGNTSTNQGSILYNVYNKGIIGDKSFSSGYRHVGGIIGHLAGIVDTSFNTGDIYNTNPAVGGIVGWLPQGSVYNSYNTGNVTVKSNEGYGPTLTAVGGIIGGLDNDIGGDVYLQNLYNLGTIRAVGANNTIEISGVGGIVGGINDSPGRPEADTYLHLDHVYSTGNIYAPATDRTGYIIGNSYEQPKYISFKNVYYIKPKAGSPFAALTATMNATGSNTGTISQSTAHAINYEDRYKTTSWQQGQDNFFADNDAWNKNTIIDHSNIVDNNVTDNKGADGKVGTGWRQYNDKYLQTLPILNAFRPKGMDDWFNANATQKQQMLQNVKSDATIHFGNTYNPYLTFVGVTDGKDLIVDADKFHLGTRDGIVSSGINDKDLPVSSNLIINNFKYSDQDGDMPIGYNGTMLAYRGNLTINGSGDTVFGSASNLYGNDVNINIKNADKSPASIKAYGNIQAIGGADNANSGNVNINSDTIRIIGNVKAADKSDAAFNLPGVGSSQQDLPNPTDTDIKDPTKDMPQVEDEMAIKNLKSTHDGNININATDKAEILAGNKKNTSLSSGSALKVTGSNEAYIDTNISNVKGNVDVNSAKATLDISNMNVDFLNNHKAAGKLNVNSADGIIALDGWNDTTKKYDLNKDGKYAALSDANKQKLHFWVNNGEQLKGIQDTANADGEILKRNFALKNDIKASDVANYQAIAGKNNQEYTGIFNGRGYSVVDLNIDNTADKNVGIFGTIGANGTIKNLRVDDINVKGTGKNSNVGIIAGTNNGLIEGVTTWGGDVSGTGNIGGIVGVNNSTVTDINANNIVKALSSDKNNGDILGGIAGINNGKGLISDSQSMSGLTNSGENNQQGISAAMGGIAGINSGKITVVVNKGTTSGIYDYDTKNPNNPAHVEKHYKSDVVGGIVGKNNANAQIDGAYNESVVKGGTNVGGIVGINDGDVKNVANAMEITGKDNNAGGIAGTNNNSIENARNNASITGENNVGGLVGVNGANSKITTAVNDKSATIIGNTDVGGITGLNQGTIDTTTQKLENRGSIYGYKNVGGVAGTNAGRIDGEGLINEMQLNVNKNINSTDKAMNFGGIVGLNTGIVNGANNMGTLTAHGATNVGGIAGQNGTDTNPGSAIGKVENNGKVYGDNYVGGIVGYNKNFNTNIDIDIAGNTVTNNGEVHSDGVAGGLMGRNDVHIKGFTLVNNGKVEGGDTVGGIIGENHNVIENSSLYNTVNGQVSGKNNVGGIIGTNYGSVTGGRDANNNYYKDQVYNNGIVKGQNDVGGLIGDNKGTLVAGYNTGTVQGKNNVGGVVGTNSGTVDQVFNTLAKDKRLSGDTNVGGLIGANSGTLSNAYNSTAINSKNQNTQGNAVGDNTNGTLKFVYGTSKLTGQNAGTIENSVVATGDEAKANKTYTDKNFASNIWRLQDGQASPLLKVFLTKVQVHKDTNVDWQHMLTYNGKLQGFTAVAENNIVYIYKANADGSPTKEKVGYISAVDDYGAHSLADYLNTGKGNNDLISSGLNKDAGTYEMFYSHQINTDGKNNNPNNLGYDFIEGINYDSTKPNDPFNPQNPNNPHNPLNPNNPQNPNYNKDNPNPYNPQNPNYNPDNPYNPNGGVNANPPTYVINKKKVNIKLTDVDRTYGDKHINNGKDYGFTTDDWAPGENFNDKLKLDHITDGGLDDKHPTKDVGDYTWNGKVTGFENLKNYEFGGTITPGKSTVNKAKLVVQADNEAILLGDKPSYSGHEHGLVNGDTWESLGGGKFDITDDNMEDILGAHKDQIGVWIKGKFYTQDSDVFKNYDVDIKPGTLIVRDMDFGHLYKDGWDKIRNFRERRAEFNYVEGGTKTDEEQNSDTDKN